MNQAIYLFCLARTEMLDNLTSDLRDFENIESLDFAGITAIISRVSLEEFCGAEAEARMQDITWVAPRAHRHEQVIEQVMRHSPVLPAHFGTLFSSLESLEEFLAKQATTFSQFLTKMIDKEEWAVKGWLDRNAAIEALSATKLAKAPLAEAPGKRYFQERQIRMEAEKQVNSWLKAAVSKIVNDLQSYAVDFSTRTLSKSKSETNKEMVVNWAFLLPRRMITDFGAQIKQINADYASSGLVFEYTGPWPPYSFAKVNQNLHGK